MQVPYDEGVATHIGPESSTGSREAAREALTGVRKGQPLSGERLHNRSVDAFQSAEDITAQHAMRVLNGSALPGDPGMYARLLFGNLEISLPLLARQASSRTAKARMHGRDKFDSPIVPARPAKKRCKPRRSWWRQGVGAREMRNCKTRSGRRAGQLCPMRRTAYEKQLNGTSRRS